MYVCMYACMPAPQGHHRATGGEAGYTTHPPATQKQTTPQTRATPQPSTTGPQGGGGVYPPYTMRGGGGVGVATLYHIYECCRILFHPETAILHEEQSSFAKFTIGPENHLKDISYQLLCGTSLTSIIYYRNILYIIIIYNMYITVYLTLLIYYIII